MKTFKQYIKEDMVAGDSTGDVNKIASGETTGAITTKGASSLTKKKKRVSNN